VALGPNGVLYCGSSLSSLPGLRGVVRAHELRTGAVLWQRFLDMEIHAAPAVGRLSEGGPLALVIGAGSPTGRPDTTQERLERLLGLRPEPLFPGTVYAMDAADGRVRWTFRPKPWREQHCAGSTWEVMCMPDLWSLPAIDGKGAVYINWSAGGITFGLRDANGDGVVDLNDPEEVASYEAGTGSTGPPVLGPGMLTVAACRRIYTFLA